MNAVQLEKVPLLKVLPYRVWGQKSCYMLAWHHSCDSSFLAPSIENPAYHNVLFQISEEKNNVIKSK
jgi:hypothetical protein